MKAKTQISRFGVNGSIARSLNHSIVNDSLLLQLFQKHADIRADLFWVRLSELFLQVCNDLRECALSVAVIENL